MKGFKLLFLSVLLCLPTFAWGNGEIEQNFFSGVSDLKTFVAHELPIMEEKMRELNPSLVEAVANDSDMVKIIKYNNWMAEHIFEEYRDYFLWNLRQKSEQTGREIKSRYCPTCSYPTEYWLDKGIMETDQCNGHSDYIPKGGGCIEWNKISQSEREHTCLYPDGFEEYRIWIDETQTLSDKNNGYLMNSGCRGCDVVKKLSVAQDNARDNIRVEYSVSLNGNSSVDNDTNTMTKFSLYVFETEIDYDRYHDWRNREQQDIIDGKMVEGMVCTDLPKKECINRGSKNGKCASKHSGPDWDKWKSNHNIPMGHVTGDHFDFSTRNTH